MDSNFEKNTFSYTYSAVQQEEIRQIRHKYMHREEDRMEQLRRLDRSVYKKANAVSIALGIIGTLLLGLGMCCCMVWSNFAFIPGIIIGFAGIGLISVSYPIYKRMVEKERKKIAPEILKLADELLRLQK